MIQLVSLLQFSENGFNCIYYELDNTKGYSQFHVLYSTIVLSIFKLLLIIWIIIFEISYVLYCIFSNFQIPFSILNKLFRTDITCQRCVWCPTCETMMSVCIFLIWQTLMIHIINITCVNIYCKTYVSHSDSLLFLLAGKGTIVNVARTKCWS